jgi:hypothetical protein
LFLEDMFAGMRETARATAIRAFGRLG